MNKDEKPAVQAAVAAKCAAQVYAGTGDMEGYLAGVETVHNDLIERSVPRGDQTGVTTDQVMAAFTAPSGAAPAVVQAPPVQAPAAATGMAAVNDGIHIPGPPKVIGAKSSMVDKLEDALYHNVDNWKRWTDSDKSTANGGSSPDVSHEHIDTPSGHKVAIFLVDTKFGKHAPEWAFRKLGLGDQYANLVSSGTITP